MDIQTHNIDATGKIVGRLASEIAVLLRGKHKPSFEYHHDHGDAVHVHHVRKMIFTGNKLADKKYHRHTGHPGGIKTKTAEERMQNEPAEVLRDAVVNMLPKNKLRKKMMRRLTIIDD